MVNRENAFNGNIQVGQRLYNSLYGGKNGTVIAIHGEQSPATCKSILGGIGVTGGSAQLEVVWDDGSRSRQVPERQARNSVQWHIFDEVADAQAVDDALVLAEKTEREKADAKECADRAHEEAKNKLAKDADLVGLKRADQCEEYAPKVAAANLRKLLKKRWPGVKFSVRMDRRGAPSLQVTWTDGPTKAEVKTLAGSFKRGSFDSMTDCYDYHRSPFIELFGGADYVSCRRDESDELLQEAIDQVWVELAENVKGIERPTPEGIKSGKFTLIEVPGIWEPVSRLVKEKAATL